MVSPSAIDLGDVNVGTPVFQNVSITNSGTSPMEIADLNTTSSSFTVSVTGLPATLTPGGSMSVQVRYDPGSATDSTAELSVSATTSAKTSVSGAVKLHGRGSASSSSSLSGLSCANSSMFGTGTDPCTLTLSAAAPTGGMTINLSRTVEP